MFMHKSIEVLPVRERMLPDLSGRRIDPPWRRRSAVQDESSMENQSAVRNDLCLQEN
jgi:hypothetical protein